MLTEILTDISCEEEYEYDSGGDPKRTVEVWVAVKDIEKWSSRKESRSAAVEDFSGVNVKEL